MLEFAASLLLFTEALATPKPQGGTILRVPKHKRMTSKDLVEEETSESEKMMGNTEKLEVQNNAYSVHAATKVVQTRSPCLVCGQFMGFVKNRKVLSCG